jgi:hypothetical protein
VIGAAALPDQRTKPKEEAMPNSESFPGEVIIRDLSRAHPAAAIGTEAVKGKWRLLDWESGNSSGRLLFSYLDDTPEITIPLEVEGCYAISLGLFQPPNRKNRIHVKLSGDSEYNELYQRQGCRWIPLGEGSCRFEEQFWRFADLSGRDLHVATTPEGAGLGFIRLIPLNESHVERLQRPARVPWLCTVDGHGRFIESRTPASQAVTGAIEPMTGSDFTTVSWCITGADVTNYDTNVGRRLDTRNEPTSRALDTSISENIERLIQDGHDTNELAVQTARENGLNVYLAHRPQHFNLEPPNDTHGSEFYQQNRHLACKTRDGRSLMQMSFAYPEVRRHLLDILGELAVHQPDGLHIIFNRGIPCTLYEEPVVKEFEQEHGLDIRTLDDMDPRVVPFRYRYITAYLTELRNEVGPDLPIVASCFATQALNDRYGLDIRGWAKSGLVQHLLPFLWEWEQDPYEMDVFKELADATACKIWPFAFNGNLHRAKLPREHRRRTLELIRAGASGLAAWDAGLDLPPLNLGHVNELELWEELAVPLKQTDIHTIGGIAVDAVGTPHYCA